MNAPEAVADTRVDRLFHALSDEKRLRILERLRAGECCVCDLAESLGVRQSLLSFHLGTLRDAGLVKDRKEGRWVHYSLSEETLRGMAVYLEGLARDARRGAGIQCCRHGD